MRWKELQAEVIACQRCARLVRYRREIAEKRPFRYRDWNYWAKPLPGFGDEKARLLILGLAPAAQGGNRTGRMFTGDRSGDWLMGTLYRFGFANQPRSERQGNGLALRDAYITATIRCAPPHNKPLPMEIASCRAFLVRELLLLQAIRVMIALGRIAFDGALPVLSEAFRLSISPRPAFAHNRAYSFSNGLTLIASYHPSQQNTQTGRLTQAMFDGVFARAQEILRAGESG